MKITTQNNLLYTNVFNNAEGKNAQFSSFSKTEDDIPVKISFSDEGKEAYKKSLQETGQQDGNYDLEALDKIRKYSDKIVMDPAHGMEAEFHRRLLKLNSDEGGGKLSIEELAENNLKVYAEMYDEIKKGYEQGTREYWILAGDGSGENDYRQVTKEEELAALNEAFDFYSHVLDGYANYGIKAGEYAQRAILNTQHQLENQPEPAAEQKDEKRDIYLKMKMAKKTFDEQYGGKPINQLVKDVFKQFLDF